MKDEKRGAGHGSPRIPADEHLNRGDGCDIRSRNFMPNTNSKGGDEMNNSGAFWLNGVRLVVPVSMQFEAGAQPERGADSPFPVIDTKYPELPVAKWYDYGFKEGIPRMLDMFDQVGVKVASHMVSAAVERNPQLAKEIVQRGHEAAGHGQTWTPQYSMTPDEELTFYQASIKTIETEIA